MRTLLTALLAIVATIATVAQEPGSVFQFDPALQTIVPPNAKVEKLADSPPTKRVPDTREGPVWDRQGAFLLYTAMGARTINKWDPRDGKVSAFVEDADAQGLIFDKQGRLLWASHVEEVPTRGAIVRLEKDGKRTVLATEYEGHLLAQPHHMVYKSDGALYFSDPGHYPHTPGEPGRIYLLKDGKLQVVAEDEKLSTGLAFSPDEKYLYLTSGLTILRYDTLPDDSITNGHLFFDMDAYKGAHPNWPAGSPGGMSVDVKGNIYSTGPGGVWIISPEGKPLGTITGLNGPANLTFGDSDGKSLFVTSRPGLYRIRLQIPGVGL